MKRIYLLLLLVSFSLVALAQESNCSDGVDNDGDGFIDCFDSDCANMPSCDESYIGKDKLCQTPPDHTLSFGMRLGAASANKTALSYGRMVVGDLDRDGTPEMVTTHSNDKKVYILDGRDLSTKLTINTTGTPEYFDHAIANLDDDDCAEIFIVEDIGGKFYVTSYDCEGTKLWSTQAYGRPFTIGLADFDHDGQVELYYKNEILDAKTGIKLVNGSGNWNTIDSGPVAVDILPDSECGECAGLELVLGGEIFAVDLTPRTAGGGSLGTAIKRFNDLPGLDPPGPNNTIVYHPKYVTFGYINSMTSVADYNLDGHLDVIMSGATSSSATSTTTVFFWDVHNNTFKLYQPKQPNNSSWPHGTGRINLADVDGDGKMNATFVSGARIYSLKEDFTLLWQNTITEQTSGFTSTTVFDFNNDNAVEIVYRDESNLHIIDGKTGNAFTSVVCRSRTANDYPIVVDVDGDGATEICVSCATDDATDINNNNNTPFGQIRSYKSSLEPWVSARRVWNQYGYFNVNVNDDLTIPQVQQKHHLVFSQDVCGTGENRALNSFLNQSAILDSKGCKTYPAADVAFVANPSLLNVVPPTCPDQDFLVSFSLQNVGDIDLNGDFPITFYSGDPRLAGAQKLGTQTINFSNFRIGDQIDIQDMTVTGTGGTFTLFAVLNDAGTTVPTPISLPNSGFDECNFSNNIVSANVIPRAFPLSTASDDHVQCGAGPSPPSGSARAFKPEGGNEQTVGYTFHWFDGGVAGPVGSADHLGSQVTGLPTGTYTVYAVHDAFQCGSDTVQVAVGLQALAISATVNVDQPFTNCIDPDGQLSVTPASGLVTDYTYEWFEGTVFGTTPPLSDSSVLRFTRALTYSVLVTQKSSGCETLESGTVPDMTVTPVVTTSFVPANCMPANSGQVAADVDGATSGYTFYWYDGSTAKPTEDHLGHTYPNVSAGNYTVVSRDNTTGCRSAETVVAVPTVDGITVSATITAQQTSCTIPNGAASANVGGSTTGYSFRWFDGDNTVTEIGTNATISGLAAGTYTVQATSLATGCTDTELITIVENIQLPAVTPSVVANQLSCLPANGAVTASAGGSPGPYIYYWFDGNIGTPDTTAADFRGANYTGITAGHYTVVAVDVNTRCGSARSLVEVLDQTVDPVVTTSTTGQSSCDPATPNGQASALVGGSTAGYKFRWFAGADTTTFLLEDATLSDRAAGTYTVKAISLSTGCFTTGLVLINDISAQPTLSLTKQDNSICSPGIGYTGSVTATFATNPNSEPGHTYTYEWRRNGVVIPGETAATLSGIDAGTYSVRVTNEVIGCVSDPAEVVVNDAVALPALTTSNAGSTNCDPAIPDGSAIVSTVDGLAPGATSDYTYRWHIGNGTATPIDLATNPTAAEPILTGVQGGSTSNYTVLVTNVLTGCESTAVVNVADVKVLPELTLTPTDNSVCDPLLTSPAVQFNGTITATVDNQAGALTNYTFVLGGGAGTQDASPNHNRFINLDGGSYTIIASHTPTGCVSLPANVQVQNDQNVPDLMTAADGSTNCEPGLEDGQVRVVTVDGNPATTTGFTFAWTGALFDVSANPTNNDVQLENIQGGAGQSYTVLVTNLSNGCQNTAVINVADEKVLPQLSLATTPNSVCDPALTSPSVEFNGTVTATVDNQVGALTEYTFVLGGGDGIQDASPNHNRFLELEGGISYTVTATHSLTGCVSTPANIQVQNDQDIPDLVTAANGSTNCEPGLEDGQARVVAVDGNPATTTGFTFAWTGALFDVSANATNNDIQLENVQGGAGQNYTVLVTNRSNGCQNTAVVNVADNKQTPSFTLVSSPVTVCDPVLAVLGGGVFDGEITANINATGNFAGSTATDFSFTWSTGVNGVGANILSNLDAGNYSVTAVHTQTGCESDPTNVQVTSARVLPAISTSSLPSENCAGGAPDGVATATNVIPNGMNYDYRWFNPDGSAGPVLLNTTSTTSSYSSVQGGMNGASMYEYTVEVTILQTGCVNSAIVAVDDDSQLPVVGPLAGTDNTLCAVAKNGTATITTLSYRGSPVDPSNFSDYEFIWSDGAQGPVETVTALAAGSYTLSVRNVEDNCTSNPVAVTIADDLFYPEIDIVSADQTSCDPAAPNGSLEAAIDESAIGGSAGVTAGYTFSWVDDVTSVVTAANAIAGLRGNQSYTITVVRDATQCASTQSVFLAEHLVIPSVTIVPVDATTCAPPNGALVATDLSDHTYYWYNDNDAIDEDYVIANFDDNTSGHQYQNLPPGNYTLVVLANATSCKSQPVVGTVGDATPAIFPAVANGIIPTDCNSAAGELIGGVHFTATPNHFTGDVANDQLVTTTPLGLAVNSAVVLTRNGGLPLPLPLIANKLYFIQNISGNAVSLAETVGGPAIDITSTGDGSIGDIGVSGFTFEWYAGIPSPTDPVLGSINYYNNPPVYSGAPLATTPTLAGVTSGLYTLQVTNATTGCQAYLPHTLPYLDSHAVLRINKTNSTICPYDIGNGSIEIQIEDPPVAPPAINQTNYQVTLYHNFTEIVPTFTPVEPVDPFMISSSLAPGSYTVHVRETYSGNIPGCVISQDVIIGADAQPPVLSLTGPIVPNTACDVNQADGQIDFTISKDSDDLTGAGITYNVAMLPDPNGAFPMAGLGLGGYSATDLAPGMYSFTVTASTGCSTTRNFTVLDTPTMPQLTAGSLTITNAEYCDPLLEQSARVLVNQLSVVGGGAENLADYRFDWFTDVGLGNNIYSGIGDPTAGKGGEDLSNVGAPLPVERVTNGAYWVVATKVTDLSGSGGIGCSSTAHSINIGSTKVMPQIVMTPFGDTACDPAVFEGSLRVDVTTNAGPGNTGTYTYNWSPTGVGGQPVNSIGNSGTADLITNVDDGTYQLTAVNEVTGCSSSLSASVLRIAPPTFTLDATASELTDCATFDGRIDNLQVFVDGVGGVVGDFDYVWFRSDLLPASIVLDGRDGGIPIDTELSLATYPAISLDKYFVKAVRKAGGIGIGCESTPIRRDITDGRIYPQVSFATVSSTACDANFDGRITVTANTASGPGVGAGYNFVWTNDPDGAGTDFLVSNSPNNNTPSPFVTSNTDLVGEGTYAIRVTNAITQCFTDGTVSVTSQTVPMEIVSATPTHVDVCAPLPVNGSGTVTAVTISNAPANTADFLYTWADNAAMNTPFLVDDASLVQNGLDVGTYYVTAKRNPVIAPATPGVSGSGCVTPPVPFTVLDRRVAPTISFATISSTACDANFDGRITVTANTASGPGVGAGYNFVWTNDPDGGGTDFLVSNSPNTNTPSPFVTSNADLIGEGIYAIRVTNSVTQCFADGTVSVARATVPMEIVSVTPSHVDVCSLPVNGAGLITGININAAPGNTADFVYTWANNPAMIAPLFADDASLGQGGLDIGTYYVTAKRNAVISPPTPGVTGSGCVTSPVSFTVLDRRVAPTVSFATLASTACDDNFDGRITVTAQTQSGPGVGAPYNFVWTDDPDGLAGTGFTVSDSPNDQTASPFSTLATDRVGQGLYAIRVTNFATQCFTDASVGVQQNTMPVEILAATATPQQVCYLPADGSVSVNLADVRVGGNSVPGDITFEWSDNGGSSMGSGTSVANLAIGSYFVQATRTAGAVPASGCVSAPFQVAVTDAREYPVVSLVSTPNTSCNDTYDATITLSAATAGIGNTSNYDIAWTSHPGGFVAIANATDVASPYSTTAFDNIGMGQYLATITNRLTQCESSGSVMVLQNTTPVQILDVAKIDQSDCAPFNGSIEIDTSDPAHMSLPGTYSFQWTKGGVSLSPVPENILTGVDAGTYTVTGTKVDGVSAGCSTAPFSVTLLDLTRKPVVELSSTPNFACDVTLANGQLTAVIFDGTAVASSANYDLEWFLGKNVTSGVPVGTTDVLNNQAQGDYTLVVVDNSSPNLGCSNHATLAVGFTPTTFSITVDATDQTLCAPMQNGSAAVTGITETRSGISTPAADLALYDYRWTDQLGALHPSTPDFTAGVTGINNLLAGDYTVNVRNALGCISTSTAGIVFDRTALPIITLEDFTNPAVCVLPETSGYLQVSADNDPLNSANYVFEWFEGADDTGTPVGSGTPELLDVFHDDPLQYTVRVTNPVTSCVNTETYHFGVETVRIQVLASAVGRTNCVNDDGSLFATTLNGSGALYNYEWYTGPTATGTPVYTTKEVTGVPMGQYTVIAVHPTHAFCESTSYTTRVTDERVMPPVEAVQRNPLTYCDPANPNGVAYASVGGQVTGFVFDWFAGAVSGAPFYTGPEVTGLTAATYVVRATDVMTQCENTASILIANEPVNVPIPTVTVLSHLTNCVDPDGALQATVNGNTFGYLLQWYDGNTVRTIADEVGEFYRDLDKGLYTTTATEIQSGCISAPVVTEILPFQELPDFDITTVPTNCEENIGEAVLILSNDVQLLEVEWHIGSDVRFGMMQSSLPKGEFSVIATTYQQCSLEKTFTIMPDILVFNGISRNNDGQNDYFEIACIQDFPRNNVKIFNRAGTLVYEANGYDNQDVLFDGLSNRGINLLGNELPDGTYFYIIDKRDGSEPRTGYLELLR